MQRQLTDDQIASARQLRASGMAYEAIKAAIGANVSAGTIRAHCADVRFEGQRARVYKPRVGRDGRVIRPFVAIEDAAIAAWKADVDSGATKETMNGLAKRLGRQRHSVAARIQTLQRQGVMQ